MIADSLPDMFGNIIFKEWLISQNKNFSAISPLEQLAYVANRGMGALEYLPAKEIGPSSSIDLNFTQINRALSVNNKRRNINLDDLLVVADLFSVKNPKGIIEETTAATAYWEAIASGLALPERVIGAITKTFVTLV